MTKPVDDDLARRLLASCAQGDERALADLHRMLAPRIYSFVFHRLRDETKAQSVVFETMYEVWRNAAKFRHESLVSTWILGIARFKSLAQLRQSPDDHEDISDHEEALVGDAETGEQAVERWQQEQIVHRCMNDLSAEHRQCLQLVYFESLGVADVAAVQGVPEGTVKTRLFHARKKMRACVEEHNGGDAR